MKYLFFTFIIMISFQSCLSQVGNIDTIFYYYEGGNVGLDTIRTTITKYEYKEDQLFELCYSQYSYKYKNSKSFCYDFFIYDEINNMKHISERNFALRGNSFKVHKFLYNNPNIEDEEEMYFYCKDIGILLYKSESWGGYGRIFQISGSLKETQIAVLLGDKIMQDSLFLDAWQE